ncbi:putative PKS/NRPS-like protein biosynthetic cluster [Bacidia gigantensis]|uniref:putative PKS/NRPS-like protein biosynthetic cluster n=1 Tax=Bacidia gigantensis TaxID=2732470 RepID=UPI001D05B2D4|nr:putative PKS/NRPS-like protein biosynthetic cluster [Bacidia gigantensis]KAG8533450.1 putative PKS/NRPS-like protein biosynthetic cluster [Bacidia gigantensis]
MDEAGNRGYSKEQLQGLDHEAIRDTVIKAYGLTDNRDRDATLSVSSTANNSSSSSLQNDSMSGASDRLSNGYQVIDLPKARTNEMPQTRGVEGAKAVLTNADDSKIMPIAIVGMSCRFPGGANNINEMWRQCAEGKSAWSEIPKERFNADAFYHPNPERSSSTASFLSPDGRTYMFDKRANGYARGEGIGTLILKPLSDALESNDPIHAVIRNTMMNQDGKTPGITMPSMSAQQALIEQTYRQAGLDVSGTDFFEAHGTGTQAGDRTEAEALANALQTSNRDPERPIFVGSVKSLMDELLREAQTSRIDEASMSQPLCTALQIALVELLKSWNVTPMSVVGHSSGEIAAAYTAGMLSLEAAMQVAYYRGVSALKLEAEQELPGAMMAVGMSAEELQPRLSVLKAGTATVACINSPQSVTISGDTAAIDELQLGLNEANMFNRKLRVKVAYHSHHMHRISEKYRGCISDITANSASPEVKFNSTVFPGIPLTTNAEYWVQNLLSPVRFSDAVQKICSSSSNETTRVDTFVEIGPHSALAGPLKQICSILAPNLRPHYLPSLERNKPADECLLNLACKLFTNGVRIDAREVNFPTHKQDLEVLTDLPPYPWNHSMRYWQDGRLARNFLKRLGPQHDLLGTMSDDSSDLDMRWLNRLRVTDLPWLKHHTLESEPIFPGAGYLSMAIEAARQKATLVDSEIKGYSLRDVHFSVALMVPDTSDGIEITLILEPARDSSTSASNTWNTFRILSYSADRKAIEHCSGLISTSREAKIGMSSTQIDSLRADSSKQDTHFYETLLSRTQNTGVKLEETFLLLSQCSVINDETVCDLKIPDTRSFMPHKYESPQIVKPQVLDAALQVAILAVVNMVEAFEDSLMPTFVEELFVSKDAASEAGHVFRAGGKTHVEDPRHFFGDAIVANSTVDSLEPVMTIKGAKFVLTSALKGSNQTKNKGENKLCWNTVWKPDVTSIDQSVVEDLWGEHVKTAEEIKGGALIEKAAYFCIRRAVETLTDVEQQNLLSHHQHYLKWAKGSLETGDAGNLKYQDPDWMNADEQSIASTLEQASRSAAPAQMVTQVGRRLPDILRQEIDPLSVMMEDGLLDRYYAELPSQDRAYEYAAKYVDLAAHKWPEIRILEIGAGTGSATSFLLKTLGSEEDDLIRCSSYMFTDISAGFFEKAREKFMYWDDILDFKTLNIENEVEGQGFEPESYDLVVAANVLHATASMEKTMTNVNRLLRPGGKLVLVELTNVGEISVGMVFGLLPGWWLGVEEGRVDGPLMTEKRWDVLLRRSGFSGLDIAARDSAEDKHSISMMVSTKLSKDVPQPQSDVTVVHVSQSGVELARCLAEALHTESSGLTCSIASLEEISPSNTLYVILDDREHPILTCLSEEHLLSLQEVFSNGKGLLWVTFGGLMGANFPEAGSVLGFLRTLRAEYGSLKCVSLDCESMQTQAFNADVATTILSVFENGFRGSPLAAEMSDLEFVTRDGRLLIPRLLEDKAANRAVDGKSNTLKPEMKPLWQPGNPLRLQMRHQGLLDTFQFVSDPQAENDIHPHHLEIEVRSTALNFHDLLIATDQLPDPLGLGVECSGFITKMGTAVTGFNVGQRVCAVGAGTFGTHARTSQNLACAIPEEMSFEVAASIPSVFSTSYYSIFHAARLQAGETILIHSAAGGIGQACIKLASLIGATIYVTVGTPEKIAFLEKTFGIPRSHILNSRDLSFRPKIMELTEGKGVDVIVNSLAGDALRESWRCIAMFGRFIELGKKDSIDKANLGMAPFEKSASFIAVGFDLFGLHKDRIPGEALRNVIDLFAQKKLSPIEPITVYEMPEVEKAFRFMQSGTHIGKIVINVIKDCIVPVVPKPLPSIHLRSDTSYLIVGGLSGIGAAFAKWMVSAWGAKNLILLSRSGQTAKGASKLVQGLEQAGAAVRVQACDVTNRQQLEDALKDCSGSFPPIRGVIQGAMVLQDSVFANMSLPKFNGALGPKVAGTRNLHEYFIEQSMDLDFFVMLSSLAGIYGNLSQSNYAAGNTYQDALAYHRVAKGLPALSIDVGFVDDAGWTIENIDLVATGKGVGWAKHITTEHLLRLIEHNIINSLETGPKRFVVDPQVSVGIEATRSWDARFSHIAAGQAQSRTNQSATGDQTSLAERIATIGPNKDLLQEVILDAFSHKLSRLLDLPFDDIHHDDSLSGHGVDSLVAVEIRNWLSREASATIPMSDVMNGQKTIMQIVQEIVKEKVKGE